MSTSRPASARPRSRRDLAPYLRHRRTGRPLVVAKIATSLDGRVAAADGSSQWLTSGAARADAHELRADSQAVVVGAGTAIADQPALTARGVAIAPENPPLRVVLDAQGRVPATGPLFDPAVAPTLVITSASAAPAAVDAWRAAGAKVETVPEVPGGVDLGESFALLGREGVLQVLVEGGGTLLGRVLADDLAHRLVVYVAPLVLGTRGDAGVRVARARHPCGRGALRPRRRAAAGSRRAPRLRRRDRGFVRSRVMFTGIVEELGRVRRVTPNEGGARLEIEASTVLDDVELGASIAVNGCCLTVVAYDDSSWAADAVIETLARTNLGDLAAGDRVNLERPVRLADRLGGHLVQGHVDATGSVRAREPQT